MGKTKKLDVAVLRSVLLSDADADLSTAQSNDDKLDFLLEAAEDHGTIGVIDWRSEPGETTDQVDRMLSELGVTTFDWTFIDHLAEMEQGEVMRNCNFLTHIRDQLKTIDLNFVHFDRSDDAFRFAIMRDDAFDKITGMARKNSILIGADFGPDEYYSLGKFHLTKVGFSQAGVNANVEIFKQKQSAQKIKSLRKMLSDGADISPDDGDAPVSSHARLAVPEKLDPTLSAWTMQLHITWFANPHARAVAHRILTGESACLPMIVDNWRLSLMQRSFLEQSYLETHKEYPLVADLMAEVSMYDAVRYWDLTIAAAGFFCFGYQEEWEACAAFYPMFERRRVITDSDEEDFERMQWALIRFLANDQPDGDDLNALAKVAPFGPLFGTWDVDSYFMAALNALCDWHIDACHAAVRGDSRVHSPGYDLLPVWILAIARQRERVTGRICLPQNALMKIADTFSSIPADVPPGETVNALRTLYGKEYGDRTDFCAAWDGYLKVNGL